MEEKIGALAEELRRSPAWERLREGHYYPLTLSDGESGFFTVLPEDERGEWSLLAYIGEDAVQRMLRYKDPGKGAVVDRLESTHQQDMYVCFAQGACCVLYRFLPRFMPREMSEEEQGRMAEILTAALQAPEKAKLPKKQKVSFPAGACPNELTAHRIKTTPCNGEKWLAHIFLHMEPIMPPEGDEPFYPYTLLLVEETSGVMLTAGVTAQPDDYTESFLTVVENAIEAHGRPRTLIAVNERTRDFFKPLCAQLKIEFEKRSSSPVLLEALEEYAGFFNRENREEDDGAEEVSLWGDDTEAEETDTEDAAWNEVDRILLGLVADPASLPGLSTELLVNLLADMESGELDDALADTIRRELEKRK